jgi:hypothetical protein
LIDKSTASLVSVVFMSGVVELDEYTSVFFVLVVYVHTSNFHVLGTNPLAMVRFATVADAFHNLKVASFVVPTRLNAKASPYCSCIYLYK